MKFYTFNNIKVTACDLCMLMWVPMFLILSISLMMAENTHHLNGEDFYRRNIFKTRRNKNDQAIITKK